LSFLLIFWDKENEFFLLILWDGGSIIDVQTRIVVKNIHSNVIKL